MGSLLESAHTGGSSLPQRLGTFCPRSAFPTGGNRVRSLKGVRHL